MCKILIVLAALGAEIDLPSARPVPDVQVLPLPYHQASFQHQGAELTRYHFDPSLRRPFLYPVAGPEGRSLTRMGHPRDPVSHSHHNSIWISHEKVQGVNFWADQGKARIVCQRVEQYEDGPQDAWLVSVNAWQDAEGKTLMSERRRVSVQWLGGGQYVILIDLQLEAPDSTPVTFGQSPFGLIGVRMAKTIGVHDGGGRILNSEGQVNEAQVFRKPARWVDYSGPVTSRATGGIALMDHPANPGHPTPFHVRNDGWMGASLTFRAPLTIEPGRGLRLRYGLWIHDGIAKESEIAARWKPFAEAALPAIGKKTSEKQH
jgi:hypothetical protein